MNEKKLIFIAALSGNFVIGKNGEIPWRATKEDREKFKEDMQRFRDLTMGHPVIMGRKTYESLNGRPLDGREVYVLTRNYLALGSATDRAINPSTFVYTEPQILLAHAQMRDDTVFVAGGGEIYRHFMPRATHMELTEIHNAYEGDTFFLGFERTAWEETHRIPKDSFDFVSYARRQANSVFLTKSNIPAQ